MVLDHKRHKEAFASEGADPNAQSLLTTLTRFAPRALVVAIIVGSALNLINQGDAIIGAGSVNLSKMALTYIVPFFVSLHGAVSAQSKRS